MCKKFQFSFSNKNELIYVEDKPVIQPIGSLMRNLIDTNWSELQTVASVQMISACAHEAGSFEETKVKIISQVEHPAIQLLLSETTNFKKFSEVLSYLKTGSEVLLNILEALVDEESYSYEECLYLLIESEEKIEMKRFLTSLDGANMMPISERNKPLYFSVGDYPFLIETDELLTVAMHELQYICSKRQYIRKCAMCKKFHWTPKMNKIYCDRLVPNTNKTCAQTGPIRRSLAKRPMAYTLYWQYRNRLFGRKESDESNLKYHNWIRKTEAYKNLAKNDDISYEDMKTALDKIEVEIYEEVS